MFTRLSRREWIAASLCFPVAAAESVPWHRPVPLGRSGVQVSRLGFGVEDVKDPNLIRKAADLGITHFNFFTPPNSVAGFPIIAEGIRPIRQKVVLSIGTPRKEPAEILEHLDAQLKLLGFDSVDLLYLTNRTKADQLGDDVLAALEKAREAGKIRAAAISTHSPGAILDRVVTQKVIRVVMPVCNPAVWPVRAPQMKKMHDAGLGMVPMKPMMASFTWLPEEMKGWAAQFDTDQKKRRALEAALRWALSNPQIDSVPVRMTSEAELESNVKAASEVFTPGDSQILAQRLEQMGDYYCRMCQSCSGTCRYGLPIHDLLRYSSYATGYGDLARGRAGFASMPSKLQDVRCESCSECTVRCRFGVRVQELGTRAQDLLA